MSDQSRFSFSADGAPIDAEPFQATPAEMAAHYLAVDRAKVRRGSVEMGAPKYLLDRNEATKILVLAYAIDRNTRKHRAKYQHGGVLGDRAIELLRLLMNFGRKYGQIFPDYDTLARTFGKCKQTMITLMKRLIREGFVTKHRRSKMITTEIGARRVQNSNAYEVHLPRQGVGAASIPQLCRTSESNNSPVSVSRTDSKNRELVQADRFWLAEPYRTPRGGWL